MGLKRKALGFLPLNLNWILAVGPHSIGAVEGRGLLCPVLFERVKRSEFSGQARAPEATAEIAGPKRVFGHFFRAEKK